MSRYNRQIVLSEIGEQGQKRLKQTSVLCIGAGGLGSPALLYLAAAGIGKIGIIDFDFIDESNLQRQVLYSTNDIGKAKSITAKQKLGELNPEIQIECYNEPLSLENIEELFNEYDFVIDGTDNFPTKFLINDAGVKFNTPIIYGAIQKFDGQIGVFDASKGACYRCLYPEPPKTKVQNCTESGVIGAVAGIIGTSQAMQVIMLAVGGDSFKPLISKLWTIDMHNMETQLLKISKNKNCPICSQKPDEIVLEYKSESCSIIPEITAEQLNQMTDYILIDVREEREWQNGHIDGAIFHPLSEIVEGILPNNLGDKDIIFYCAKGVRSMYAAQIFKSHNFQNKLLNLKCGYDFFKQTPQKFTSNI